MTTEFVNDPIVPLQLRLKSIERYTLYQPGWYTADDGSAGFLGGEGNLYGFASLDDLVSYIDSGAPNALTPSPHLRTVRIWPAEEYAKRLCFYDLTNLAEIADGHLDADEQASLGSSLALMLDLLDYMEVETEDSQALHDDEDISKLASGDEVLAVFRAAHHRENVVNLLRAHWPGCLAEVSRRVVTPEIPSGGRRSALEAMADGSTAAAGADHGAVDGADHGDAEAAETTPLEEVSDALTFWLGLADEGVYAVRSTDVAAWRPRYVGRPDEAGQPRLSVWSDLDQMRTDLRGGEPSAAHNGTPALDLSSVLTNPDVSLTPHDDCIFDLVEIADSITTDMEQQAADRLVSAWTELVRLATWGGWTDVEDQLRTTSPAGGFVLTCAVDVAQDRPGAAQALASADTAAAAAAWHALIPTLTAHLEPRG